MADKYLHRGLAVGFLEPKPLSLRCHRREQAVSDCVVCILNQTPMLRQEPSDPLAIVDGESTLEDAQLRRKAKVG